MNDDIIKLLGRSNYIPSNVPELLRLLRLERNQQQRLQNALKSLERVGQIARIKGNRYILPNLADLIPGRIMMTRQGRGYLIPDDSNLGEIAVSADSTSTAMHEDRVLIRLNVRVQGGKLSAGEKHSGSVVRVLERRRTRFVGTFKHGNLLRYVIPDDPRIPQDIYVPQPKDVGCTVRNGDKVVVELLQWESRHTNPEGQVIEVLGSPSAEGVDMLSVLRHYDLPLKFPAKVLQAARQFGSEVTPAECKGRIDCRGHHVITIDPDDARDFDDAFYLKKNASGWNLWVHIADVSHYVKPGSTLDVEARKRGNSTYLVDRVIPMLPEALSNELCSLKPDVDRLTKCVEFNIDNEGKVLNAKCYSAVIHSKKRFTYREALSVIQNKSQGSVENMLREAHRLAQKIRRRRFKAGALELDFPETKIRLDAKGRVRKIERHDNDESHQLIEEFMLLANEAVAQRFKNLRRNTIHRIHEKPDSDRLRDYREEVLAHGIPCGNLEKPGQVQQLLKRLGELAIGPALKIGFLKSLMRACYSVEPLGHYGLAKANYTHFTSPIRRYADLIVHRTLFERKGERLSVLKEIADHLSVTERNSSDSERDSKNVKLFAFLNHQLKSGKPSPYAAMVTQIRNFGFFVDVPDLGMSGLVPLSILEDDFYEMDPDRIRIIGRRTRRIIRLGDQVVVQVAKVDTYKKQVDFKLLPKPRNPKAKKKKVFRKRSQKRSKQR